MILEKNGLQFGIKKQRDKKYLFSSLYNNI